MRNLLKQFQFFFGHPFRNDRQGLTKRVFDGQSLQAEVRLARFDPGEDQEVIDEPVKALGVLMMVRRNSRAFARSSTAPCWRVST